MSKEYKEINRLRRSYERTLNFRLIRLFSLIGDNAANSFSNDGLQGFQIYTRVLLPNFRSILEPFYLDCLTSFAKRLFKQKVAQKAVEDYDTIYKTFMRSIGTRRIVDISERTRQIIENIIVNNKELGVVAIASLIREKLSPIIVRPRSFTIARTETHTASSFAIQKQAELLNQPQLIKRWVSNTDERTRASHRQANGQEVGIDDDFNIGGKRMKYTGDPKGGASEVINCRCVIIYTEPDDEVFE